MKRQSQGGLLPMVKFREILRLHELGYNQSEIARSCLVARATVQDYIRRAEAKDLNYQQLKQLSDSEARGLLGKGKAKQGRAIESFDFERVHRELKRKGVTLALLWQEGLDRGDWQCSYGNFCRRYNQWKRRHNLSMRQVYKGGDKLLVDYCGLTVEVVDPKTGEITEAQIFVACLGASNYTFAEATASQKLEEWIGSHSRALSFFGGVPERIVPDNLKSGVTSPCRYEPGINRSYQEWAEHYGVAVIPARPLKPRDKAKVEKAVQEVERQILAPLRHQRFSSFAQLNQAMKEKQEQLNSKQMKGYGLSRRELFEQVDRPQLKPLPQYPFVMASWKQAKVSVDYHLEIDRHYYSVPYRFVGARVSVKLSRHLVEVFYENQRIAAHERARQPYRHTTLPEHMPPEHWAYKSQSKEKFLAWAARIGPQTTTQVEAIFARKTHEEQAFRALMGVQRLARQYSGQRLEAACKRANAFAMVGLRRIRSILESQLDEAPIESELPALVPIEHDNLRGAGYYH